MKDLLKTVRTPVEDVEEYLNEAEQADREANTLSDLIKADVVGGHLKEAEQAGHERKRSVAILVEDAAPVDEAALSKPVGRETLTRVRVVPI